MFKTGGTGETKSLVDLWAIWCATATASAKACVAEEAVQFVPRPKGPARFVNLGVLWPTVASVNPVSLSGCDKNSNFIWPTVSDESVGVMTSFFRQGK